MFEGTVFINGPGNYRELRETGPRALIRSLFPPWFQQFPKYRCLVPRPQYYAWVIRFGSRGPGRKTPGRAVRLRYVIRHRNQLTVKAWEKAVQGSLASQMGQSGEHAIRKHQPEVEFCIVGYCCLSPISSIWMLDNFPLDS